MLFNTKTPTFLLFFPIEGYKLQAIRHQDIIPYPTILMKILLKMDIIRKGLGRQSEIVSFVLFLPTVNAGD